MDGRLGVWCECVECAYLRACVRVCVCAHACVCMVSVNARVCEKEGIPNETFTNRSHGLDILSYILRTELVPEARCPLIN